MLRLDVDPPPASSEPAELANQLADLFTRSEPESLNAVQDCALQSELLVGGAEIQATDEPSSSEQSLQKIPANTDGPEPFESTPNPPQIESQSPAMLSSQLPESGRSRLLSFTEFRSCHLLAKGGMLNLGPWLEKQFPDHLAAFISENLSLQGLPKLYLAVRAAKQQDLKCLLTPEVVRRTSSLVRTGQNQLGERDDALCSAWAEILLSTPDPVTDYSGLRRTGLKLLTFVHAFSSNRPIDPKTLLGGDDSIPFTSTALRNALEIFHHHSLTTDRWVEHLRDRLDSNATDRRQMLAERIAAAKKELRAAFRDKANLRVETSHCRQAWADFMMRIAKEKADLLLDPQRDWVYAPLPEVIKRWGTVYTRTMDNADAKYHSRNKMDRAFQDLSDKATDLAQMLHIWNSPGVSQQHGETDSAAIGQLNGLIACDPLADLEEELCRLIIRSVLRGHVSETAHLDLTLADFIERPQLLELLNELPELIDGDMTDWQPHERIVSVDSVQEPVRATARFLEDAVAPLEEGLDLLTAFREVLVGSGREDLDDRLIRLMDEPEKRKLWSERRQEVEALQEIAIQISELGGQLGEFADSQADLARELGSGLREISQTVGRTGFELMLMKTWSHMILETSQRLVAGHVDSLRAQASDNHAVLEALDHKDYARAMMLTDPAANPPKEQRLRATWWRNAARTRIPIRKLTFRR